MRASPLKLSKYKSSDKLRALGRPKFENHGSGLVKKGRPSGSKEHLIESQLVDPSAFAQNDRNIDLKQFKSRLRPRGRTNAKEEQ